MLIAIANSRKDKRLKNIDITWEEFLSKLSTTRRTAETVDEYKRMRKAQSDDIKDVGAFIGGRLIDGSRKSGCVEYRSMITLDLDYANVGVWDEITMFYDFTCCIYSTHKHTPEKPRLRLVILLSRNVTPDEYIAIARMVACDIGIDMVDVSSFRANQLMYFPSTSSDGEFVFERQDGSPLDADAVLSRYEDWKDSTQWPVSIRENRVIKNCITKQADPLDKDGVIGAFCRTYTIEQAIEKFLPNVYRPSVLNGRYDYITATSTAGVIIYDSKFAFSHHATDIASGKLCNAFDLVRIHKFGEFDEVTTLTGVILTNSSKLPSFKAMQELCVNDEMVKRQLVKERMDQVAKEFDVIDDNWQDQLSITKKGEVKDDLQNLVLIMRHDENLKSIAYNQHRDGIDVRGILPWEQVKFGWNDSDMSALKVYFNKKYGIWSPMKLKEALIAVATERAYHPVKDYFEGLSPWDGTERINKILIDYLGADDNEYSRAVIRKTLVAAVTRIYEPGTKFDGILILNGPQGCGKSTLFQKLGGKWFSDSLTLSDMRDKSAAEKLQGNLILELGELSGIRKMDVETVKSFVSRTDDKYRASYGVNVESHPRQCVIVGTTNSEGGFLRDITGNRRFWPVKVSGDGAKKSWDLKDVDQIWAEALVMYKKGEDLFLKGNEAEIALAEQAAAMESDDREGLVREYLDKLLPEDWSNMNLYQRRAFLSGGDFVSSKEGTVKRQLVCNMEIWCECFGRDSANLKKIDSYEINAILSKIKNWKPYDGTKSGTVRLPIYNKQRVYMRVD